MPSSTTAIGCRVKSGWAMTVLLAGPVDSPRVLDRRRIELSDPSVPDTIQPYHVGLHAERTDAGAIEQLTRLVARCAHQELAGLVRAYRAMGHQPTRIGIVVGSIIDPATIANPHIRAHAQEGRLFRTVVEAAAKELGIASAVLVERDLYATAARTLGGSPGRLQRAATDLGRTVGRPWAAQEKTAVVAAWLALTGYRATR
ncbi:MAG TPA: hypothetical protein VGR09_15710 [Gemmatimonadales bacterium]|nr:hypothetical protein [Gemmatimonadales bacterium]